jgi:hypothetical protein
VEQKDSDQKKPRLPEALHPELGNGALWESDPHFVNLRRVEPGKDLDKFLLDANEREEIIRQWSALLQTPQTAIPDVDPENADNTSGPTDDVPPIEDKTKGKEKKILVSARDRGQKPDWFESMEGDLVLKDDPNKPGEISPVEPASLEDLPVPEGKRVRKAAKKAQKEQKVRKIERLNPPPRPEEASLSPFTRWLKSLKGSEYVHPYEDDYALEQLSGTNREGISETFADLLAAQGYKDQALDMYKLLMAKYPEKSSFFAAKIEALK